MIWRSDWLETLPNDFIDKYSNYLLENLSFLGKDANNTPEHKQFLLEQLTFGRMQACQLFIMPWIEKALDLKDKKIVEIGAGQGSSTVALAKKAGSENIAVLDINDQFFCCLLERFRLLGLPPPELNLCNPNWIMNDDSNVEELLSQADVVYMYALFEHLLPKERVSILKKFKNFLKKDAAIIMIETPNRLTLWDWHTTKLFMSEVIPDQLYIEYMKNSRKGDISEMSGSVQDYNIEEYEKKIYRAGRGVSFHEFDLAIGLENIDFILDGYTDPIRKVRDRYCKPNADYERGLRDAFDQQNPPIPHGFARPSLDFIFRLN